MTLAGRVALVTGGSRGIGRAIALGLAEDGADVAVNYRRDTESAAEPVAAIEGLGRRARAYRASVGSYDEGRAMVEAVLAHFGHVDPRGARLHAGQGGARPRNPRERGGVGPRKHRHGKRLVRAAMGAEDIRALDAASPFGRV